jgi:hypothetical protein
MKNKGEILASILTDFQDCYFFLHNTKESGIVEKIMTEGFIFESQLPNSTDRVNPSEPIEITYFFFQRKDYGLFTIIIAIPRVVYDNYTIASDKYDTGIEEVLTISEPYLGDNDEPVYTVSPKHILGYFNIKTMEFIRNKIWDPSFDNSLEKEPSRKPVKPGNLE